MGHHPVIMHPTMENGDGKWIRKIWLPGVMLLAACATPAGKGRALVGETPLAELRSTPPGTVPREAAAGAPVGTEEARSRAIRSAANAIVAGINVRRALEGRSALIWREDLQEIARLRAGDMISRAYLSHQDPVSGAVIVELFLEEAGYAGRVAESALRVDASLSDLSDLALGTLLHDETQRAMLLDPAYRYIGVGLVEGVRGWMVVVALAEFSPLLDEAP